MNSKNIAKAICPLDCYDTCAFICELRDGKVVSLKGDPEHPITKGFICSKMRNYPSYIYSDRRILKPLLRTGAKGDSQYKTISWQEALERISSKFSEIINKFGSEAILPFVGSGTLGKINRQGAPNRFFNRLGASRLQWSMCSAAGSAGYTYTMGIGYGLDPEAAREAKLIILWGINPVHTNIHFLADLVKARKQGARIILIDPHRTKTAKYADKFLQIRPSTDSLLALGIMKILIEKNLLDDEFIQNYTFGYEELKKHLSSLGKNFIDRVAIETSISKADIEELAVSYGEVKPSYIRVGLGMQHHLNGGMMLRNIACLPALVGAWKYLGGGMTYSNYAYFQYNEQKLNATDRISPTGRFINVNRIGAALCGEADGTSELPIQALFVCGANPLLTSADYHSIQKGLAREDLFTVVHEQVMTETAKYADLILPATMQLEHWDLHNSYWHPYLGLNKPCLEPQGEAKSNYELFKLLAEKMGFNEDYFQDSPQDMIRKALDTDHPFMKGITFDKLLEKGWMRFNLPEGSMIDRLNGKFPTATGKIELYSNSLKEMGFSALPFYKPISENSVENKKLPQKYPIQLLTVSAYHFLNTTFSSDIKQQQKAGGKPHLKINIQDAQARNIKNGDLVRVYNDRGEFYLYAEITEQDLKPGVALLYSIWAQDTFPKNSCLNMTTSAQVADLAQGSGYNSNLVQIERA